MSEFQRSRIILIFSCICTQENYLSPTCISATMSLSFGKKLVSLLEHTWILEQIEYITYDFTYPLHIHTNVTDPLKNSSAIVFDQRIRRVFTKSGSKGPCILLWDFSLRHFIFMLINSDLSQMEEIFLKGYDIQSLPLWFISTYSLFHWVF